MKEEIKNKVLELTDIVDIIGEVVDLRKRGTNYIGLCPFHQEKTPSFTVSPEKSIYKCFGCGRAGNALTFMMDYYGYSFQESLKILASKVGIRLEEKKSQRNSEQTSKRDLILEILEKANEHYHNNLKTTSGKAVLSYFHNRGYQDETINDFSLGYSINSWDNILKLLKNQGYDENLIFESGLLVKNEENGTYYDRFRGRAMFPIQDKFGKVIGFGARILTDEKDQPKYINTPQTLVYDKSKTLYGLFQAKNEIRSKKYAIMVEGYADVITLHQAGFKNSISSSGTALTNDQLAILKSYCKKIYFVYDADEAGIKATERGLELAIKQGFEIFIVLLPKGEDPDSLIKKHGKTLFEKYLDEAVDFIEFIIELKQKQSNINSPTEKAELIRYLVDLVTKIPDRLQHDIYISKIASSLNLTEKQLEAIYTEKNKIEAKEKTKEVQTSVQKTELKGEQTKAFERENASKKNLEEEILPEEKIILHFILKKPEILHELDKKYKILKHGLITNTAEKLFRILVKIINDGDSISERLIDDEEIEKADKSFLLELLLKDDALINEQASSNWKDYIRGMKDTESIKPLTDAYLNLEIIRIEKELKNLKSKIKEIDFEEQKENIIIIDKLLKKKAQILKIFDSNSFGKK
jgi:DNA primase